MNEELNDGIMNNLIGKFCRVFIKGLENPYMGTLIEITDTELIFQSKDGLLYVIPRGEHIIQEARNKGFDDGWK